MKRMNSGEWTMIAAMTLAMLMSLGDHHDSDHYDRDHHDDDHGR
jgi:hypothetical protein